MAVTIYVKLKEGESDKIRLRDSQGHMANDSNITSKVKTDDTVTWQLDNASGLSEITGIKYSAPEKGKYQNSVKLWDKEPKQNKDGSWTVTITNDSTRKGKHQNYMVGYKIMGSDEEHWEDPKLLMT